MWQIKDSKLVSKFNVMVTNIPKDMTSKLLHVEFSKAGEVFSSKIPDSSKTSDEGFGFVCFFDEDSMNKAISMLNNTKMGNNTITVERYEKKSEVKEEVNNNLYVKDFPLEYTDDELRKLFEA